jgi:hypothetical protein
MTAAPLSLRQDLLIRMNIYSLEQACKLLISVDEKSYRDPPAKFFPHRAGAHLRHVLEFYECFLDGLETGHIDYDARRRDLSVETNRAAALAKIRNIVARLEREPLLRGDMILWVRMEDAQSSAVPEPFLTSSPARELQVLASHTVHHFALIAMTLAAHGVAVDPDFGVAPSTLRFRRRMAAEAA